MVIHDGVIMVSPANPRVRPAADLFGEQELTDVLSRGGRVDTLFVNNIGCGIGDGPPPTPGRAAIAASNAGGGRRSRIEESKAGRSVSRDTSKSGDSRRDGLVMMGCVGAQLRSLAKET